MLIRRVAPALWASLLLAQTGPDRSAAVQPPPGVEVQHNLAYSTAGGKPQLLDLYRPKNDQGVLPVVVWIHGGAFRMGRKDDGEVVPALALARHGYAVASINYRLSQEAIFPAQIQDCKAAIRWLRTNADKYKLDPAHIGVWGSSAGGYLVAMLGTTGGVAAFDTAQDQSSRVQAVVDFYGPTDFSRMDAAALPGGMKHDPPDSPESQLIGGPVQENKEKVAKANPITYVSKNAPPFLILHGERDLLVPVNQSELLFAALSKAGSPVIFHKIAGAGHGGPQFDVVPVRAMVLAFFDQHLKPPSPNR